MQAMLSLAVVILAAALVYQQIQVRKTMTDVEVIIEGLLAFDQKTFSEVEETRLSRLAAKAAQIQQRMRLESSAIHQEKETLQSLITEISHQMKTPLANISMDIDLLQEMPMTAAERHEFLGRARLSCDKLNWMTDSLINIARLETGAIELKPQPLPLMPTLEKAVCEVQSLAAKKQIEIHTAFFDDQPVLHDPRWTGEAIVNLLDNAIKYSEPGSPVQIRVERLPMFTKISVINPGTALLEEDLNQIFRRFVRGKNAADQQGAGIGLYLVRLIQEKQGGMVMADCNPDTAQTLFTLFLQNCKN